ncbi:MAG TPA: serine/threonine-protein kinase [Gemmatimonadaceae bacterium]|jgi:serine/threonine-protein kinase
MAEFAEHLQNALGSHYQLDHELAGGGMSRVFVATDRVLGRKVVVKVLPPELAAGVNRDRFRREIQVVAQLQHPHIVPLLSAGEQDDLLWYTMPFIDGESLRVAIEGKRKFSPRDVMRILHDVVDALAFAHARGVIHRDIKPANVLMQGAHALVTDFGVAKAISAAMPIGGVTSAGIAIGTPAYMAPEQLAGDASADHRMDIYAVGLLAYEMVTGVSPFTGPSPRETLAAQLTRDPTPLHELSAELPRSLSDMIMQCLAKDPNARPQTADAILQELDAMTMPLSITPQRGGVRSAKKRRPWAGIAAVAILFVVLAGVGYVVSRAPTPPTPPRPSATATQSSPPALPRVDSSAKSAMAGARALPAPPAPPKPLITHDDSVRIAIAVAKKVAASKTADSVAKVKLAAETQRKMIDSIIAANSGAPGSVVSPVRRVAIAEPSEVRGWPEAPTLAQAVSDSLRRMLRARSKQYAVADQDSVRSLLARTRDVGELGRAMNSDIIIAIRLTPTRGDSAMMMTQIYDLTAPNAFRTRTAVGRSLPKNEVLASLDQVLLQTMTMLDETTRAPRRQMPPGGPPPSPPPQR